MIAVFHSIFNYKKICRDRFKNPRVLREEQFDSLRKTLRFAQDEIPYYRNRWGAQGLDARKIRGWKDFLKIPLLSKQELRTRTPEEFLPMENPPRGLWKSQTTGSTGIPIVIYRSGETDAWSKALLHFSFSMGGVSLGDRFCQILHFLPEKPQPAGFAARLGLKRYFPVSLKLPEKEIWKSLVSIRPQVLYSFPSVLFRLAEYAEKEGLHLDLKCLFGQGEVLPASWRKRIEQVFGAPLYHSYGATEFPRLGFECSQRQGYHLPPQAGIVELLREDGSPAEPGEEAEVVLTHLRNFTMPLIRYRIGDKAILSKKRCTCGISYPLLENVTGRMDDFVLLPDGRKLSARALTHLEFEGILQHKIIQRSPSFFEVLVIPSAAFSGETVRAIEREIRNGCQNEDLEVRVTTVESLPVSRTGKFQAGVPRVLIMRKILPFLQAAVLMLLLSAFHEAVPPSSPLLAEQNPLVESQKRAARAPKVFRFRQGTASWYSRKDRRVKKLTASGEKFDDTKKTCASWDFKFGTRLKVINAENGKHVVCRVNDRGPSKRLRKRMVDLSKAAFREIADLRRGLVRVRVVPVESP